MNRYPIYIVSKDRAEICTTHKILDFSGITWSYAVEPQDYEKYVERFGENYVVNIGENDKGIYYVRNFCIEHSKNAGHKKHWQVDDDLKKIFYRAMQEKGTRSREEIDNPGTMLKNIEDYTDDFSNFGAGCLTHDGFAFAKKLDIDLNKMIYCFQLMNNNVKARYQPHTSEDVDFSVNMLREKWVTMVFNQFSFTTPKSGSIQGGCNSSVDYQNKGRKLRNLKLCETFPQWFKEYTHKKTGLSEIKPSKIWRYFKQKPEQIKNSEIDVTEH